MKTKTDPLDVSVTSKSSHQGCDGGDEYTSNSKNNNSNKNKNSAKMRNSTSKEEESRKARMDYAKKTVEAQFEGSSIQDNSHEYPKFEWSELTRGKVLGKGGFGTVYEVRAFDSSVKNNGNASNVSTRRIILSRAADEEVAIGEMESRKFISDNCIRNGGDARYAVKVLSPEVIADPNEGLQGIMDMATETRILSDTEHPNIIKMRAMASCSPYSSEYFIVMDRLYDTLEKRLKQWQLRFQRATGIAKLLTDRKGKRGQALYEERIVAAFDLSAALEYLHKRRIVYRDLKPENIGFDIRGDIKIFDFGLSKELRPEQQLPDGTFLLTDMTGSPRYMAPEVAMGKPYNWTCDSYSFAILLWEMLHLKTPFELYTMRLLKEHVYAGAHKRPPIDDTLTNASMKLLLKRSWCADWKERNTMENIAKMLRAECIRARNGDDSGLEHNKRRSTFVFRPSIAAAQKGKPRRHSSDQDASTRHNRPLAASVPQQ